MYSLRTENDSNGGLLTCQLLFFAAVLQVVRQTLQAKTTCRDLKAVLVGLKPWAAGPFSSYTLNSFLMHFIHIAWDTVSFSYFTLQMGNT